MDSATLRLVCKHVVLDLGGNFGDLGIYQPSEYERPTLRFGNAAKVWSPSVLRNRMSKVCSLAGDGGRQ